MAITDYPTLVSALKTFAARVGDADFADSADTFIQLGSSRLNRILPLRVMETEAPLTGTVSSRLLNLPADYVEPYTLHLTTFGDRCRLAPDTAERMQVSTLSNGTPSRWAIDGASIGLDVPCDQAHTFLFRYRKSFAVTATSTTTWLLTTHPDVYLAAALLWGGVFMKDDPEAAKWKAILDEAIEEILWKEARSISIAPLGVDAALLHHDTFNIRTGSY